nr:retrovirus-related Pol polyprotein from transposon TNT 1-94 [Tanacetum cinerariifolium]
MWMRTQLQDYGFNYNKIPLYCDSQSATAISCNPIQHFRTKHIHTRYHFIKGQVENGIIEIYFVRTEYQLADMFTKALPEDRFKYLVKRIEHLSDTYVFTMKMEILLDSSSNKLLVDVLVMRTSKHGNSNTFVLDDPTELETLSRRFFESIRSQPHSSGIGFITTCSCSNYKDILSIKIQESRKLKHKDRDFRKLLFTRSSLRYQVYQGRLLASFQDDAKYEHGGQDTRSQGGKDDQDKRIKPEWSRFVTIVKQQHKLDEVSYHKLFNILKQYQNEVNELRAERLARNANPLALVATAQADRDQYYQTSRSHRSSTQSPKPSIPSRSHTSTKHKGKEIAKPITPPSKIASEKDSDPEQAQRDKDMQKNLALIVKYFKKIYKPTNKNLRTSSNSKNKNVDMTLRFKNDNQSGYFRNQRTVNVDAARENVGSKVQNDAGYNVVANHLQHSEQSESVSNTCLVEMDDSNVIPDLPDMCEDDIQNDQNDVDSDDERIVLANLKLDVDENKKIQKQLKKANTTLAQELK